MLTINRNHIYKNHHTYGQDTSYVSTFRDRDDRRATRNQSTHTHTQQSTIKLTSFRMVFKKHLT